MMRHSSRPQRQRGVALLAAVLVVAIGLLLLTALLQRGEVQRARSAGPGEAPESAGQ